MDHWKIYITYYDPKDGHITGYGIYIRDYQHKQSAVRQARNLFNDPKLATWIVSKTTPWSFPQHISNLKGKDRNEKT